MERSIRTATRGLRAAESLFELPLQMRDVLNAVQTRAEALQLDEQQVVNGYSIN